MLSGRLNQQQVAEATGQRRSTVANLLRLLKLPLTIQAALEKGEITLGHAKLLLSLKMRDKQLDLFWRIRRESLSVRQAAVARGGGERPQELYLSDIEEQLRSWLGSKVELLPKGAGGRIVVHYCDLDDLQRLLDQLNTNPN